MSAVLQRDRAVAALTKALQMTSGEAIDQVERERPGVSPYASAFQIGRVHEYIRNELLLLGVLPARAEASPHA